jgi:hypothetical protein
MNIANAPQKEGKIFFPGNEFRDHSVPEPLVFVTRRFAIFRFIVLFIARTKRLVFSASTKSL